MRASFAIYDGFFNSATCSKAAQEWPAPEWEGWNSAYCSKHHSKKACNIWNYFPPNCSRLLSEMMLFDVNKLGLGPLIPDISLWGAGMNDMGKDDKVGIHVDASHHLRTGMKRVLNTILFLNSDWRSGWGGDLELWDRERERPLVTIAPVFNRLVVFRTADYTWHRVQPLTCPENVRRKTLALWWYSPSLAETEIDRPQAQFAESEKI